MHHSESTFTNAEVRVVYKKEAQVAFAAFLRPVKIVGEFKPPLRPGDIVNITGDMGELTIVKRAEQGARVNFDESDLPMVGGGFPSVQSVQQVYRLQCD